NYHLDTMERKVHEVRLALLEAKKTITANAIKNMLTGKDEKPHMLLEVFTEHNARVAALKGTEYAPATVTKYNTSLEHTRAFIKAHFKANDVEVKSLSYEFLTSYEFWLKSEKKCAHNSAMKHITILRKIVYHCIKSGWLLKD